MHSCGMPLQDVAAFRCMIASGVETLHLCYGHVRVAASPIDVMIGGWLPQRAEGCCTGLLVQPHHTSAAEMHVVYQWRSGLWFSGHKG